MKQKQKITQKRGNCEVVGFPCENGILLPKLFRPTVRKNYSSK